VAHTAIMPEDLCLKLTSHWEHWCYTGIILCELWPRLALYWELMRHHQTHTGIMLEELWLRLALHWECWAHTDMVVGKSGWRVCSAGMYWSLLVLRGWGVPIAHTTSPFVSTSRTSVSDQHQVSDPWLSLSALQCPVTVPTSPQLPHMCFITAPQFSHLPPAPELPHTCSSDV